MHTAFLYISSLLRNASFSRIFLLGMIVFISIVMGGDIFANNGTLSAAVEESELIRDIIAVITIIQVVINMVIAPTAILAGWLLTPDWTFGDFFGLRPALNSMWVIMSNITYIIFAIMLLVLALMHIFGKADSSYQLKQSLPRFVVGILIVPFSWFIVSFTLSVVNQAVAAVMTLPQNALTSFGGGESEHNYVIPGYIPIGGHNSDKVAFVCKGGTQEIDSGGPVFADGAVKCLSPNDVLKWEQGPFYVLAIYAFSVFEVTETNLLHASKLCAQSGGIGAGAGASAGEQTAALTGCINSILNMGMFMLFDMVTALVFSILLLALSAALLYRAFMMWIYAIFSPFFGLVYFIGPGKLGEKGKRFEFMEFFKLAAVPVVVSFVLSIGIILVGAIDGIHEEGNIGAKISDTPENIFAGVESYCTDASMWFLKFCTTNQEVEKNGVTQEGATFQVIIGNTGEAEDARRIVIDFPSVLTHDDEGNAIVEGGKTIFRSVGNIFSKMILMTIILVIIWMATMAALKIDNVTAMAAQPFENFGKQVGQMAKTAPGLIKVPGSGGMRLGGVSPMLRGITGSMQQEIRGSGNNLGGNISKALGLEQDKLLDALNNFRAEHGDVKSNIRDLSEILRVNNFDEKSKDHRELLIEALKRIEGDDGPFFKEEFYREIRESNDLTELMKRSKWESHLESHGMAYKDDIAVLFESLGESTERREENGDERQNTGSQQQSGPTYNADSRQYIISGAQFTFGTDNSLRGFGGLNEKSSSELEKMRGQVESDTNLNDDQIRSVVEKIDEMIRKAEEREDNDE